MKKELRKSHKFTIITLSDSEFKQYKVALKDEICIQGAMYDYDKKEILEDSIRLYCVRDYKEEFLLAKFFKQLHKKTNRQDRNHAHNCLVQILTNPYTLPDKFSFPDIFWRISIDYQFFSSKTIQGFLTFESPPPKLESYLQS